MRQQRRKRRMVSCRWRRLFAAARRPGRRPCSPEEHEAQGHDLLPGERADTQELLVVSRGGRQHRHRRLGGGLHLHRPAGQLGQALHHGRLLHLRAAGGARGTGFTLVGGARGGGFDISCARADTNGEVGLVGEQQTRLCRRWQAPLDKPWAMCGPGGPHSAAQVGSQAHQRCRDSRAPLRQESGLGSHGTAGGQPRHGAHGQSHAGTSCHRHGVRVGGKPN